MTFFVGAEDQSDRVRVQHSEGSATFLVDCDRATAARLWGQLGHALHGVDHLAELGYTRYRDHAGGQSVKGDPLPEWRDVTAEVQAHWRHVFDPYAGGPDGA